MGASLGKWLVVAGFVAMAAVVVSPVGAAPKGAKASHALGDGRPKGFNTRTTEKHLRDHQRYPATKAQIVAECDNLSDFTDADRKWFTDKLPDGNYQSPDAVLEAVGLKAPGGR